MKGISFGQYYPAKSFVHKMDARIKILLAMVYLVCMFFVQSFFGFAVILVLLALMIAFSGVPAKSVFKSVKPIIRNMQTSFNMIEQNVDVETWQTTVHKDEMDSHYFINFVRLE